MIATYLLEQGGIVGIVQNYPIEESHHEVLFCPACGTLWGRILFSTAQESYVKHSRCIKHGEGSFFSPLIALDTVEMSEGLIEYEARISLLHPEKYQQLTRYTLNMYRV